MSVAEQLRQYLRQVFRKKFSDCNL